jgi:hypothetical protein
MALHKQQLKHIKTWQASGASKTVYCQNNGLNIKTLTLYLVRMTKQPKRVFFCLFCITLINKSKKEIGKG